MDQDTNDAWWAQAESEQWQRHVETVREFREENGLHNRRDEMALVKNMIQSKFLRKEDFEEDQVLVIKGCKLEQVGRDDDPEERWVLYFRERDKGMVLNITTIRVLEQAYGGDTDMWVGNKVMVYNDPNVTFGGKITGGLRLRTPSKKSAEAAPVRPADPDFDDKIPF